MTLKYFAQCVFYEVSMISFISLVLYVFQMVTLVTVLMLLSAMKKWKPPRPPDRKVPDISLVDMSSTVPEKPGFVHLNTSVDSTVV